MNYGNAADLGLKLKRAKAVDIRDIDARSVKEFSEIKINKNLPHRERILDLIEQAGNPYFFKDNGILVKVSFADSGKSMQECMEDYLQAEMMLNKN